MILIQKKRITYVHESYNQFTEGMCVINNFYPKKTDESILISFAAGKVAADCICSTISTVIGDADLSAKSIQAMSAYHPKNAAALRRLKNLGSTLVAGARSTTKRRVQMCANTVKARIFDIARSTIEKKPFFLENTPYPSFIIDEGLTWSKSMPLYAATCVCTSSFEWKTMFIGQEDSSGRKDGESIHQLMKKIFVDNSMEKVYDRLIGITMWMHGRCIRHEINSCIC